MRTTLIIASKLSVRGTIIEQDVMRRFCLIFCLVTACPGLIPMGAALSDPMTPAQIKTRDAYLAQGDRKDRVAGKALDRRFTLAQRKRMDYELVRMQDRAGAGDALDRVNSRFGRKYHLTYDQVIHLMVEGEQGRWPLPLRRN